MSISRTIAIMAGVAASGALVAGGAVARDRHHHHRGYGPVAGELHPNHNPYGPGVYAEGGRYVYAGPNCYVSREQVLENGRLVWRPLATCSGDRDR